MDIGPTIRPFAKLQFLRSLIGTPGGAAQHGPDLLELRSAFRTIYVCPSRWQRVRLGWAFRHFHVLPPQLLSPADQRLVTQLVHSAVVTPKLPVTRDRVFGVIENVRYEPPSPPAAQAAQRKVEQSQPSLRRWSTVRPAAPLGNALKREGRFTGDVRSQQWGALGVLAVVCTVVILVRFLNPAFLPGASAKSVSASASVSAPATAPAQAHISAAALPPLTEASTSALVPAVERSKPHITLAAAAPVLLAQRPSPRPVSPLPLTTNARPARPANELEAIAISAPSTPSSPDRLFVTELPQGHFAEPIVTDPRLVGELRLKALIGADGSVKDVTVVSGNPKLAEAGMRAVRRWRYQALGHPGEAETLIRMRFFGQDGVSIASIAK